MVRQNLWSKKLLCAKNSGWGMFFIHSPLEACLRYHPCLFPYILTSVLCEIVLVNNYKSWKPPFLIV